MSNPNAKLREATRNGDLSLVESLLSKNEYNRELIELRLLDSLYLGYKSIADVYARLLNYDFDSTIYGFVEIIKHDGYYLEKDKQGQMVLLDRFLNLLERKNATINNMELILEELDRRTDIYIERFLDY